MKNNRTSKYENGVAKTTTFNKNIPLNVYKNTNSRLDKPESGECLFGCTSSRMGAPYRAPIAGYRKTLVCCSGNKDVTNQPTNTIYGDSKAWVNLPGCVRYDKRIRSGMQPKKQSCGDKEYSFSYSEYNKNRKLNTYDRGLEINPPTLPKEPYTFKKSSCINIDSSCNNKTCNPNTKTTWKPNNKTFKVQGAVSSGSRIDRLKLDTLRVANSKCSQNNSCDKDNLGKGPYFGGRERFDGWMFNSKHPETVCNIKSRQVPFGVPQLNSNNRPTRSNKMVGINLRQKHSDTCFIPRYKYSRAPGCGKCQTDCS